VKRDFLRILLVGFCLSHGFSTAPATAGTPVPQVIRGPYLQNARHTSITVRWRTNIPTTSMVSIGPAPDNLLKTFADPTLTTEHSVEVFGRFPALTYYAVGTTDMILVGPDADHLFSVPPIAGLPSPTRIWVLGDSGTGDANAMAVRDAMVDYAGEEWVDLWLMLGDNAYFSGTDIEYQTQMFDIYPDILRTTVLWPTLGNHDALSASSTNQSGPYYDIFGLPTAGESGGLASGTEAYYAFDFANIHFVSLDSHLTDRSPNGPMLTWLAQDLAATDQDWILVFWHHPPYSKGSHNSDIELRMVEMRENAVPILEDHGVDVLFTGHSHNYERSFLIDSHYGPSDTFMESHKLNGGDGKLDGDGAYTKPLSGPDPHQGTVYAVAGTGGSTHGGSLDHPAMYTAFNSLGSLLIEVDDQVLNATFVDDQGEAQDYFRIVKSAPGPTVADFTATPVVGYSPMSVQFQDTSTNAPLAWSWDLDGDGAVDSLDQHPSFDYVALGVYTVEQTVTNLVNMDQEIRVAYICVLDGPPQKVTNLITKANGRMFWDAQPSGSVYDVIRGDLGLLLASGGDFESANVSCKKDDHRLRSLPDFENPSTGEAFFYIVRSTDCSGTVGSYDSSGIGQAESRDSAIAELPGACPD
jgi:PKD repeat protein